LNKASVEGIVEGRHASPLLEAERVAGTGGGAAVGVGVVAGVDVVGVDVGPLLLAELLDPQPVIAETKNKNVSEANAANALDL
jgi:hypothetical protein